MSLFLIDGVEVKEDEADENEDDGRSSHQDLQSEGHSPGLVTPVFIVAGSSVGERERERGREREGGGGGGGRERERERERERKRERVRDRERGSINATPTSKYVCNAKPKFSLFHSIPFQSPFQHL